MSNIEVSESALQNNNTKKIIDNIFEVEKRYNASEDNLRKLSSDLTNHKDKIAEVEKKAKEKWFSSTPDRKDLFELIKSDQRSNAKSASTISKMIKSVNDNTKDLANMIHGLAMISSFTLKKTSETVVSLEELHGLLKENFDGDQEQQSQMKQVIKAHIKRAIEEKERNEAIDLNFIQISEKVSEVEKLLEGVDEIINHTLEKKELEFNNRLKSIEENYEERLSGLSSMWGSETDITLVDNYKKLISRYKKANILSIISIMGVICFSVLQLILFLIK